MSRISLSDIAIQREAPDLKEKSEIGLSQARLENYKSGLGAREGNLLSLIDNTIRNSLKFTAEQEESKKLIEEEQKAENFRNRFFTKDYDEELDYYAKQAGLESQGKIYFSPNDTIETGYMNYFEASDAGSMYGGSFELIQTNAATLRTKTQMMGSDALLKTSKAWSKIKSDVGTTSEDKTYYDRQLRNSNNWERWVNIDSAESLAQTVPIVDSLFTALGDQTPEEVLLQRKDPNFDGKKIVDAIKEEDPEFLAFLRSEGVSIELLAEAVNPYQFKYIINSSVQGNAIARSLKTSEMYHTTAANWALFGLEQARASLTSGDFVGQVALTAATAGLGAAVAGVATTTNMLTASSRASAALKTSKVASDLAKAGQMVTNIRNYLPANIPSTLLHKLAPNGLIAGKNLWATGGSWFVGQMAEGFVEEGLTDVWNQVYELNEGTRLKYNYGQTWEASYMGALMEPLLGGALTGITIPITITTTFAGKVGTDFAGSLFSGTFNIPQSRFREMNLYFDSFMGKFNQMSPEERQVRIGTITSALVTEAAMNEATNNQYGKTEDNVNFISRIFQVLQSDQIIEKSMLGMQSLSGLAVRLNNLRTDLNKSFRVREIDGQLVFQNRDAIDFKWQVPYSDEMKAIFSVNLDRDEMHFTKEGAELFMAAMVADSQGNSETRESNITEIVLMMAREKVTKKIKDNNPGKTDEEIDELVEEEVSKEGESEFTKIKDALTIGFEIVGNLNQSQTDQAILSEDSMLEPPKPEPETATELMQNIQQLREEHIAEFMANSSTPEAVEGIPELLARPTEEEMQAPKPWSMMDEVTSVPIQSDIKPTPGTSLSILKHGQEKDQLLSVEATVAGKKPITKLINESAISRAKELGLIEYPSPKKVKNQPMRQEIFGLPNEVSKKAAEEYWNIIYTEEYETPERTYRIGKLFGYTDQEIADFVSGKTHMVNLRKMESTPEIESTSKIKPEIPIATQIESGLSIEDQIKSLPIELQLFLKNSEGC